MRAAWIALLCVGSLSAAEPELFKAPKLRIAFLGDSNTAAGTFISEFDAYLAVQYPAHRWELLNLGLSSETVSGLSEKDHPFPRPCVMDRLDAVLTKAKPDLVIACYGMNDGIYAPFDAARFRTYRERTTLLVAAVRKAGAKIVLMTPAPFDPLPVAKKVVGKDAADFSYKAPYDGYDDTLSAYSRWLLTQRQNGIPVADPHTRINEHLETVRKFTPGYFVSGDGIHPNAAGHTLILAELLRTLDAPVRTVQLKLRVEEPFAEGVIPLRKQADGSFSASVTMPLPLPLPGFTVPAATELERIRRLVQDIRLTVELLPTAKYKVYDGQRLIGEHDAAELARGIDPSMNPAWQATAAAKELYGMADARQKLIGLAWLTHVGHNRPGTPKGLPLEEAQQKASVLDAAIRKRAEPIVTTIRFVPMP